MKTIVECLEDNGIIDRTVMKTMVQSMELS